MKYIIADQPELVGNWVLEQQGAKWNPGRGQAIGLFEDERIIAGVVFDSWNGASMCIHVAAVPGARWRTRQYLNVVFYYAFEQMGCKKLLGLVGSGNKVAQRFDEHLGFVLEATLEAAHPDGNLLVYSMTKEQCRWLTRNYLKENIHGKTLRT